MLNDVDSGVHYVNLFTEIHTHILGALNNEWVKANALPLEL